MNEPPAASPVRLIPDDRDRPPPTTGTALCLSGGGYRAMLVHVGALWRLNEAGYLPRLTRVSSVSGGSITAAVLGRHWGQLHFSAGSSPVAENFKEELVVPVRALAGRTIDVPAVLAGLLLPGVTINKRLTAAYDDHLFKGATLQDLPTDDEGPRFVINATNLQSGVLWRFSRPFMADYRVGLVKKPDVPLAVAVAASSAFPPVLAPMRLRLRDDQYAPKSGKGLQKPPYTTRPTLADGGVYDNLGLETAWKSCKTVLVSDGGGVTPPETGRLGPFRNWRWRDWGTQTVRVLKVIDNQVGDLRKRQIVAGYREPQDSPQHRLGTYWGIRSDVEDYSLETSLPVSEEVTTELAAVPTRLKKLDDKTQAMLINWGYAICDTAMRKWVDRALPPPSGFPYPNHPLG
ncbi:MAG TPA: patatin-like phospholipase family protein [Solirubrobacterales bacterium]|nr:patatin-like phospholipase family protein [Solirubrobacterales bacterium]